MIALLIAGFLVPAALINAQQRSDEQGERGRHHHEGKAYEMPGLDLSDEQKSQIKEIHLGVQKEILPMQNQLNENRARMKTLTTSEDPNMDEINNLIDQSSGIRADMQKIRASAHQEVRKLLTEDQRVMFDSRSSKMMAHRHQGKRMRRGEGKHNEQ